jgi:acetylornithine deacetylase
MNSVELLDRLIAFPTVSLASNHALMDFVRALLQEAGVEVQMAPSAHAGNLNLFATIGPKGGGGVMLSGHTDVVPVDGQPWTVEPFHLTRRGDRLYGRGTADMKGFVACALRAAILASGRALGRPLHLALSCDEEVGCVGVRSLLDALSSQAARPDICIVGEPTSMRLATGHKGKIAARAVCTGRAGHSAYAPRLLNAISLASELVQAIDRLQDEVERNGVRDEAYETPHATLHVGRILGGEALNVVAGRCTLELEIRSADPEEAQALFAQVGRAAQAIAQARKARFPEADIAIALINAYPGLDAPEDDAAAALVRRLIGVNETVKVAFGTEGGLIKQALGTATVICGPGSMDQGHKPDEYVTLDQIARCDRMMDALIDHLAV